MRSMYGLSWLLALFYISSTAQAQVSCDTDCNARCPEKKVKVFGKTIAKGRDPTCKLPCEAKKPTSCIIGVPIPAGKGAAAAVEKALNQSCSIGYEAFTKLVMVGVCSEMGTPADAQRFDKIRSDLISAGLLTSTDFTNVTFKYCAKMTAGGLTPDRNTVYVHISYREASDYDLAVLISHEMRHVKQYRDEPSTDSFKCKYSKKFVACGACQDDKHDLEKDAYAFEARARVILAAFYGEAEKKFASDRSMLGTFGVAGGPCSPRKGPAFIYQDGNGILTARNECGGETALIPNDDGSFSAPAWKITAQFSSSLSAIMWSNNTQWIRTTNEHSLISEFAQVGAAPGAGLCKPRTGNPKLYIRPDGMLVARNECGNESQLNLLLNGNIIAKNWGSPPLSGESQDQGRTIKWSNGTYWSK